MIETALTLQESLRFRFRLSWPPFRATGAPTERHEGARSSVRMTCCERAAAFAAALQALVALPPFGGLRRSRPRGSPHNGVPPNCKQMRVREAHKWASGHTNGPDARATARWAR